jgi:hypothetical protein
MSQHARHAEYIDRPIAGLIADLKRRGMLEVCRPRPFGAREHDRERDEAQGLTFLGIEPDAPRRHPRNLPRPLPQVLRQQGPLECQRKSAMHLLPAR